MTTTKMHDPAAYAANRRRRDNVKDLEDDLERDDMLCTVMGIDPEDWDSLGNQARRIIGIILPEFVRKFVEANKHYGPNNANVLGPAGQFADIWRKIGPLRRALWDGVELTREGPDEICKDLIGHLLLTIDMLQQGVNRRGTGIVS